MSAVRILAFSGSARKASLNKKLIRVAAQAGRDAGAEVTLLDLDEFTLPVYHGDLEAEQGMPENAMRLREAFLAHDALMISTPENNWSTTALLKNSIDWLSRSIGDGKGPNSGLAPFRGKVAALMGATPGPWGTLRGGLPHLDYVLSHLGVLVLGTHVPVAHADEAFADDGSLKDAKTARSLSSLAASLVQTTAKLKGPAQSSP